MTRTLRLAVLPLAAGLLAWTPAGAGAAEAQKAVRRGSQATTAPARTTQAPARTPTRIVAAPPRTVAAPTRTAPAARATPSRRAPQPTTRASAPQRAVRRVQPVTRDTSPTPARSAALSTDDQRRQQTARPRQGSSGGGERAVPRQSSPPPDRSRAATGGRNATGDRAVDRSRDRGDRPSYGTAVTRRGYPRPPSRGFYPGYGYRYPWYWYSAPVGFGLYYWDPYWGGYPYYGGGYYGGGYGYGGYGYYSGPASAYYGSLRLKVKPREAEVFVDGYFAGRVDDFDGIFQRLHLDVGPHRIEIRHPGFEPITFEVRIQPDQTITYEARMVETGEGRQSIDD